MFERNKWRILRGDKVVITAGKDRGQMGTVLKVIRDEKFPRVIVEGQNLVRLRSTRGSRVSASPSPPLTRPLPPAAEQAPHQAHPGQPGRHCERGVAAALLQRAAGGPGDQRPCACHLALPGGRLKGAVAVGGEVTGRVGPEVGRTTRVRQQA